MCWMKRRLVKDLYDGGAMLETKISSTPTLKHADPDHPHAICAICNILNDLGGAVVGL